VAGNGKPPISLTFPAPDDHTPLKARSADRADYEEGEPAVFQYLKTIRCCLILLAVSVAGFSDARATVIIDSFLDGDQVAVGVPNTVTTSSGIGGERLMQAQGETLGGVVTNSPGTHTATSNGDLGGIVITIWGDGGTLGGVDLTEGGVNSAFEIDVLFIDDSQGSSVGTMELFFTDSDGDRGRIIRDFTNLLPGMNLFPFSELTGQVDLDSVDEVELTYTLVGNDLTAVITSFSVVPEPSTGLLFGSGLGALCLLRRRTSP